MPPIEPALSRTAGGSPTQMAGEGFTEMKKRMDEFSKSAKDVSVNGFGKMKEALNDLWGNLKQLPAGIGEVAKVAGAALGIFTGLSAAMAAFVSQADPAAIQRMMLAVTDLMAVIGHALVPIFNLFTDIVRAFGDTLATFVGQIGGAVATVLRPFVEILKVVFEVFGRIGQMVAQAAEAIAPALAAIGELLLQMFKNAQPIIDLLINLIGAGLTAAMQALADIINTVIPYVMAFARVVGDMVTQLVKWIREGLALLGISIPDASGTKPGSSTGAAVRQAQIGSVESYLSAQQTRSFQAGAGPTPETRTASAAEAINIKANEIYEIIRNIPDKILQLPGMMAEALLKAIGSKLGMTSDQIQNFGTKETIRTNTSEFIDKFRRAGENVSNWVEDRWARNMPSWLGGD